MKIIKLENNHKDVKKLAGEILMSSGLVIFPTETCYGAGVLATDQKAVDKLLKYKKRPHGKAISIAVDDIEMAYRYASINKTALDIYDRFLPGPITVISKYNGGLAEGLASEFGTIGIRIPDYHFIRDLVNFIDTPISATSANSAGKKTPYSIDDVLMNLTDTQKDLIDLIIDAGTLPKNPPSTVIDTTKSDLQILRRGQIGENSVVEKLEIKTPEEMQKLGKKLIHKNLEVIGDKGLIILFNAELGAGKTQFVKGIGEALKIKEIIKSPTYSLIEEYDSLHGKLIHIDAWRLENLEELKQLEIEQYMSKGNVLAVEWSGGAESYFLDLAQEKDVELISIDISYNDVNTRKVRIIYS